MASDWKKVPFNELGEVNRGRSRHRPRYAEHLYGGNHPFIQTGDVREANGRITRHSQTYSDAGLEQSRIWPAGTMCISIVGANVAETAILTYPACFPDSVIGFIADPSKCVVEYVEYFFRTLKKSLKSEAIGSARENLNLGILERVLVRIPPLPEQKAIAHILGTLDDKIELNRQMNATLEAMAQALFKSWFVDFDPVIDNALAAGHAIPEPLQARAQARAALGDQRQPLPEAIQKQFPNQFVFHEEMGWVPDGWTPSTVGTEFIVTMGQSPPGSTYNELGEGIPFFQGRADYGFRYPSNRVYCTKPKRFAKKNDTLVSVRAPVGDVNMAAVDCCIGRGVAAVRHRSGSRSFTYYSMQQLRQHFNTYEGEGTVFGSINQKDFNGLPQLTIDTILLEAFHNRSDSADEKIQVNEEQLEVLGSLRDTLLPKLLSGELRIPEAEQLVSEVL